MARRRIDVFSLSFLDAITCGFGAVILFFMIINASVGQRTERVTSNRRAEVDRLEVEVLDSHRERVEIRNMLRDVEEQLAIARGLSVRLSENVQAIQAELATYDGSTIARREQIERLKADLKSLDEQARRLSAAAPSDEVPGDRLREFVGDGDRQYLTGLKVGGRRILILVDASASMLGDTIVNIVRRRNLPDEVKIKADKWQRAVSTVDWLTTQIPRESQFQIYTFNEEAAPVIADSKGLWLRGDDRDDLERAVAALRAVVPGKGTNLCRGLRVLESLRPAPDNLILLVDGLPTLCQSPARRSTVSGKQRIRLFAEALELLPLHLPVNVILFPMEGDPLAPSAYWKLAVASGGSFLSPSEDWP